MLLDQLNAAIKDTKPDLLPSPVGKCDHVFMLEEKSLGEIDAKLDGMAGKMEEQGYTKVDRVNYGPVSRMLKGKPVVLWVFYAEVSK